MSRNPDSCSENIDPIQRAGRRLSCETVMFHQAVADRLGLNVTDHKCVDFLLLNGPSTAGELAEMTSLTTGAITAVLDRLERAGFVRREPDPADRRRVIVRPVLERVGQIGTLFTDLSKRVHDLAATYTESELAIIIEFMNRSCEILRTAAMNLRAGTTAKNVTIQKKRAKKKRVARDSVNQ